MKILGTILIGLFFMTTVACNDAEFSNEQSSLLEATAKNIDQSDEVTKKDEDQVFEQMEEDFKEDVDVMVIKEPVEEIIIAEEDSSDDEASETDEANTSDADTYLCKNKGNLKNKKYMICHVPRGNPANAKSKCLPKPALKAHIQSLSTNGSIGYMGPCK